MIIEIKPEMLKVFADGLIVGEVTRERGQYIFHHHHAASRLNAKQIAEVRAEVAAQIAVLNITIRLTK